MALLLALACGSERPRAEIDALFARTAEADLARRGTVHVTVVVPDGASPDTTSVHYRLQEPGSAVADADIRGFVDGSTKYAFNQGRAYHLRLGRRYGGRHKGRLELKRALVRFALPAWPAEALVRSAGLELFVERFLLDSPLGKAETTPALHVFAYPIRQAWNAGEGGTARDNFSDAAPGEVNWNEVRVGEEEWESPGALALTPAGDARPYADPPLGHGTVTGSPAVLRIEADALGRWVDARARAGRTADFLVKLGDAQEDRFGTEFGILSSDFGHPWDEPRRGPALDIELEVRGAAQHFREEIILELGSVRELPVRLHPSGRVLIDGRFEASGQTDTESSAPRLFVRGGGDDEKKSAAAWEPLDQPLTRDWSWSQILVSSRPHPVPYGEPLLLETLEGWVQPGPREVQTPDWVLIAPSGARHVLRAEPVDPVRFRATFLADEVGVWRYGWSFSPMPPQPAAYHGGAGLFTVELVRAAQLQPLAASLRERIAARPGSRENVSALEAFIREATHWAARGGADAALAEREIASTLDALREAIAH